MSDMTAVTRYAINGDRPPQTWTSEWTMLDGERIAGGDPPVDFRLVTLQEFQAAQQSQSDNLELSMEQGFYDSRLELSRTRQDLVKAGLSIQVARILAPDPLNDYTIDGWA